MFQKMFSKWPKMKWNYFLNLFSAMIEYGGKKKTSQKDDISY